MTSEENGDKTQARQGDGCEAWQSRLHGDLRAGTVLVGCPSQTRERGRFSPETHSPQARSWPHTRLS